MIRNALSCDLEAIRQIFMLGGCRGTTTESGLDFCFRTPRRLLPFSRLSAIRFPMPDGLQTNVQMLKGVGPQRAELLAKRGMHTLEDLLGYLPFRYEDRLHFSQIKDVRPNNVFTLRVRVASGQAVGSMRGRDAIYHLLVQDDTGSLPCKFFHGGYLEGRLKPGQLLVLHGKAEVDRLRPARVEMINPQFEVLSGEGQDSTEVGRIVPI